MIARVSAQSSLPTARVRKNASPTPTYTPGMLRAILERWEHLSSLSQATGFLCRHANQAHTQEALHGQFMDVQCGLRRLPAHQRRTLFVALISGLSTDEAAETLHVPRTTLHSRVESALVCLSQLLSDGEVVVGRGEIVPWPARTPLADEPRSKRLA